METNNHRFPQALALLTVVETGSFTRAAERLGVSKAQVSKQVSALEAGLGVKLLHRTTRRVGLTEAGQLYLDYARQARDALDDADRAVSAVRTEVDGLIRLTAPTSLGDGFLMDLLADFRAVYPAVRFDVDLSIAARDLIGGGFDFAIRMARTIDPSLVARPLGLMRETIVASPAYLAERGHPQHPRDLERHACITLGEDERDRHWRFERAGEAATVAVRGRYVANHSEVRLEAALQHLGIASLPRFTAQAALQKGQLIAVLPDWEFLNAYAGDAWLLYPPNRFLPSRVRAWVDYLASALAAGWRLSSQR